MKKTSIRFKRAKRPKCRCLSHPVFVRHDTVIRIIWRIFLVTVAAAAVTVVRCASPPPGSDSANAVLHREGALPLLAFATTTFILRRHDIHKYVPTTTRTSTSCNCLVARNCGLLCPMTCHGFQTMGPKNYWSMSNDPKYPYHPRKCKNIERHDSHIILYARLLLEEYENENESNERGEKLNDHGGEKESGVDVTTPLSLLSREQERIQEKTSDGNNIIEMSNVNDGEFMSYKSATTSSDTLSSTSIAQDSNVDSSMMIHPQTLQDNISATTTVVPATTIAITTIPGLPLAPASEIAYFYLQNTIGLGPEVMWKISNDAGSVLGFTVQNLQHKISLLTRMMNLSMEDVREIITKQPSILHMSPTRNISPTILFLVRSMDLSKTDLKTIVVAYPCILCYSIQNLANKMSFFRKEMGLNTEQMRELILSEPKLLCSAVETGLLPRLTFLHREMSLPMEELRRILRANPRLLLYSLDDNLRPKLISFFIMRLYMQPKDVLKLLVSYPRIMDYSLENHMLPIAIYFLSELEFSPVEMKRILLKFPRLMTHSLFKIKHVVGYLRYQLGMNAKEVKRVLFQAPQVISLNTDETVASKVKFLREKFGLTDGKNLRKVISGMPTLLLCNTEQNLRPKAEYLLREFGGDRMEMRQAVITLPTLLGYSLEKRIKPRMEQILDRGMEPIKITVAITLTDGVFQEWLDGAGLGKGKKKKRGDDEGRIRNKEQDDILDAMQVQEGDASSAMVLLDGRIRHWKH